MEEPQPSYLRFFDRTVLQHPVLTILLMGAVLSYLGYRIKDFRLDASADSLVLEHDLDLKQFRETSQRYSTKEYLILAYRPRGPLLHPTTLNRLRALADDVKQVPGVESVITILDIPLLQSPPIDLKDLRNNPPTLESSDADLTLAETELRTSPIFQELLVSQDLTITALQINFEPNQKYLALQRRRGELLNLELNGGLSPDQHKELKQVKTKYDRFVDQLNDERHEIIRKIRGLKPKYEESGTLFLGGIAMISDDMVSFVKNDLKVFGLGMLVFLIVTLWVIFRRRRWILLPMVCCICSAVAMIGILGISGWEVTVISSNFISLQLIVTMSLTVHLIVRYNELIREQPDATQRQLIQRTVYTIFKPCLYTSLTTVAGFSSLIVCDILPVVNFGWMMSLGLCVSLILVFLLFPAILILFPPAPPKTNHTFGYPITHFFARVTEQRAAIIFLGAGSVALLTFIGITRLKVENSFIDYFKQSTEIYQGMKIIDQQLGGTTPLDIIIDLESEQETTAAPEPQEPDEFSEFDEFSESDTAEGKEKYWFTMQKLEQVRRVHEYLETHPAVGKVLSLTTLESVAQNFSKSGKLDNLDLALLFNEMSDDLKEILVNPYVSIEENQIRLSVRVKDSMPGLQRDVLLKQIQKDLTNDLELPPERVKLVGIMVLYNNMLQSLFKSQIQTIGFTVLALMIMFLILFRSVKVSIIAIFPNLLASVVVLGVMGLLGIPLDMMTITIVAISVGIAVDNTIHYIHRFEHEFQTDHDYMKTMFRCHGTIGNAMYYTSMTIIIGFSILALSNFIPSVLFGVLTSLAMLMALVAALTLLPRLILLLKPF